MMEAVLVWLLTPLSGASTHSIPDWMSWHARLMVLAWGILLPVGAVTARYYKITRAQNWPERLDNKRWWHTHRLVQSIGVLLMSIAVFLAFRKGQGSTLASQLHAWLGWSVCVAAWLQVVAGVFRGTKGGPTEPSMRGDHFDMTPRRVFFEWFHKSAGWISLAVAVPTIALGLVLADAPRWMPVLLALWWCTLFASSVRLQKQGRCVDTYQAIWGPDASYPGNQRPPIGMGVRRYTAQSWREKQESPLNKY
jgi:hypothetical protein